jgi:hypothetical protein
MAKRTKLKYGFLWVTLFFFLISLSGHWISGWFEYCHDQKAHQEEVEVSEYLIKITRGTLENWQSEFLQLVWQVAGLAFLLYVGSPQSKEGDDRKEEKLDHILRALEPEKAEELLKNLDKKYPRS